MGGYAKPMPPSWLARQQVEWAKRVALADIVISTALIPGRAAPTLITEDMVKSMKPGSVIVDIALISGGADTADAKLAVMEECRFTVTRNPSEMGRLLKGLL